MPNTHAGSAAALASTARQVGATIGVAVAGVVTGTSPIDASYADSSRPLWWLLVGVAGFVVLLGLVSTSAPPPRSAAGVGPLRGRFPPFRG